MYPFLLENGDFRFNKIRVHTLCFLIFFARPVENAIVTEDGTIFDGSMRIHWYPKWRFQKSPLRRAFSKRCVFGDLFDRIRVDGRLPEKNLLSQTKTDTCGRCTVPQKEKELRSGCYSPEQTSCPFDFYLTRKMDLLFSFSEMEWVCGKICRKWRSVYRS